jgi:hypothetical protein
MRGRRERYGRDRLTRRDLIRQITELTGLSRSAAARVLRAMETTLTGALSKGDSVDLTGSDSSMSLGAAPGRG